MPEEQITTIEYSCTRCSYKWITRKNGKENSTRPKSCARCKSHLWDTPRSHNMARFYKERLTKKGTRVRSAADMSEKERKVLQRKQWSAEGIPIEFMMDLGYSR
jgi:hypothetical protein